MQHTTFSARQSSVFLAEISHEPVKVAFTDLGSGPPLILMHGIPTWSFLYHEVMDALAESFRVIAPDFIGHGCSDLRDRFDRSLVAQRDMVLGLMAHLELERATLIGHDTGGGVSLMLAIENPDRVERLVLSNIVAYDSWPIDDMLQLANPTWRHKSCAEICDFLAAGFAQGLSRRERLNQEFMDGMLAPYGNEAGKLSLIRNASGLNTSHTMMLAHRHHQIEVPTLLVWGEDDPWQPVADAERLAREIPGARLVRVANASHWIPQDAPHEWLAHVTEFLRER